MSAFLAVGIFISFLSPVADAKSPVTRLSSIKFSQLPGWSGDNHAAAYGAFRRSCIPIVRAADQGFYKSLTSVMGRLVPICRRVLKKSSIGGDRAAKSFFEEHFTPHRVGRKYDRGLLTGYYEPELNGSLRKSGKFQVPVYKKPADLVVIKGPEMRRLAKRHKLNRKLTWARISRGKLEAYATRRQIENGHLRGRGLELLYLENEVETFFLHIQGSGRIKLGKGRYLRIGFDAKNGYPYSSIGKKLIKRGEMTAADVSMKGIKRWMRADPKRARELMWQNKSFIFFRKIPEDKAADGPIGAQGVSLTPGRSLAIDRRYHRLGTPIFVVGRRVRDEKRRKFRRLMIAQDTGSAIKGVERGDIFWGSGDKAGRYAGKTYSAGQFYVLLPKVSDNNS